MKKLCRQASRKTSPILTTFVSVPLCFVKKGDGHQILQIPKQNDVFCIATRRTTLHKKRQKNDQKIIPNSSKIGGRRRPKHASEKRPQKSQQKSQKCRTTMILGPPKNKERTRVERTFRHFLGFERLWGSPGAQNGPKTSPKPSQDPSKPRFLVIVYRFSDDC